MSTTKTTPSSQATLLSYTEGIYRELLDTTTATMRKSLSVIADELRPSITEIAANLRYMTEGVTEINDAAESLRATVTTQRELSARVRERFEAVQKGNQEGVERLINLDAGLSTLRETSSAVGQMLTSVEDIAGQLNVISINGSIQASHTGAKAAGFRVIAGEMKRMTAAVAALADQQRERIKDILKHIRTANDSSAEITRELTENSNSLEAALDLTKELNQELDAVASAAEQLSATVSEFSAGIEELSATIGRVAENIEVFHQELSHEVRANEWIVDIAKSFPRLAAEHATLSEAADAHMKHIMEKMRSEDGSPLFALARVFVLQPFRELPAAYQQAIGDDVRPDRGVLCLAGTAGIEAPWNDRCESQHHKHILLPETKEELEMMPMLDAAFSKMGVPYSNLITPTKRDQPMVEDYLLVPQAAGSSLIPAQRDFIGKHNIQSLLGVGGILNSGRAFACFLFFREAIDQETAARFRILPATLQRCFSPFDEVDRFWPDDK